MDNNEQSLEDLHEILDKLEKNAVVVEKKSNISPVKITEEVEKNDINFKQFIESYWRQHTKNNELECYKYATLITDSKNYKTSKDLIQNLLLLIEYIVLQNATKSNKKTQTTHLIAAFKIIKNCLDILEQSILEKDNELKPDILLSYISGFIASNLNKHQLNSEDE